MSDHSECANKIQLLQHECDRSREALTAAEERAQRAERDAQFERERADNAGTQWAKCHEMLVKQDVAIAALTPLAEEGRKHIVRRLAALELIESGAYHPKRLNPEISRDISAAFGDGEIVNVADGISPWFELTDKGRERLAYLRGLIGEAAS